MNHKFLKDTVLVLNRNWQAINVKTPLDALSMMFSDSATGLDTMDGNMLPVKWNDWVNLPFDEKSDYVRTVNAQIRAPKIIVLCNYDRVPRKRPKLTAKNIWQRDGGICQYTGQKLNPSEGNIDHVVPRAKGGKTTWTNCVLAHKEVNTRKGDLLVQEAGLKLLKSPKEPQYMPTSVYITNKYNIPEWNTFLLHKE